MVLILFASFPDLNVLDWSRNNQLAIALGPTVYLWNSTNGNTTELLDLGDEDNGSYVSSLSFAEKGKYLAVGIHNGDIQVSSRRDPFPPCLSGVTGVIFLSRIIVVGPCQGKEGSDHEGAFGQSR